tara:strand:+ start:1186 stop:1500 length:315 start_codon:yes stop_codon:yes gene_type:complete
MTKKNDTTNDGIVILLKPHNKGKFAVGITSDYVADTSEKEMCKMVALGVAQLLLEDPDPFYERGIEISAKLDEIDMSDATEFIKEDDESNIVDLTKYINVKNLN